MNVLIFFSYVNDVPVHFILELATDKHMYYIYECACTNNAGDTSVYNDEKVNIQ